MNYSEKLKDPRWQKKRLIVLERDNFACHFCLDPKKTLHVHHIGYGDGEPWDVDDKLLITLCDECHKEEEEYLLELQKNLLRKFRNAGLTSDGIWPITKLFVDTDRGWNYDISLFDVLKYAIDNDDVWFILMDKFNRYLQNRIDNREGKS